MKYNYTIKLLIIYENQQGYLIINNINNIPF